MELKDTKPFLNPELSEQKLRFVNSFRERRKLSDPKLQEIMTEINSFPPGAKSYISFLTNTFLEPDIYDKIFSNPEASERILVRLLNTGLSLSQAQATVDYFKHRNTVDTSVNAKEKKSE